MINRIKDSKGGFTTLFNTRTGEYIRAFDVKEDPFMAEYPHLIDCGIMGHCEHGKSGLCMKAGIKCYQDGLHADKPNMTLEDYKKIIDESEGKMFEIALGGCGDPDMHENFEEILRYTRAHNIIPNFTTSGLGMTPEKAELCKMYCGAVAVSQYSRLNMEPIYLSRYSENVQIFSENNIPAVFDFGGQFNVRYSGPISVTVDGEKCKYWPMSKEDMEFNTPVSAQYIKLYQEVQKPNYTMRAIKMLLDAGVKTNIHYVLSNTTIDEALIRLKYNGFPQGINAVVFLLHKPVGLGTEDDVLKTSDPRVKEFFELVDNGKFPFKIGFDSCSIPGVLKWCKKIDGQSIDTCEGGRFSMYITADMKALPCSFDNQDEKYAVPMVNGIGIQEAWDSENFEKFRSSLRNSCSGCSKRVFCMGGCPLRKSIVLCDEKERDFK